MPAVVAAASGSDWNAGGSVLTFYFPIALFVVIAALLYLQFGRPHAIPGRKPLALGRTSTHATQGDGTTTGEGASPASPSSHVGSRSPETYSAAADDEHQPPEADG